MHGQFCKLPSAVFS